MIDDNSDVLVQMSKVPQYLPISLQYAYDLVRKKTLPSLKIGGKLFIREAVLLKIKESGTAQYESVRTLKKELVCEPEVCLQPKLVTRNAFAVIPLKPDFGLSGKTYARE